MITSLRSIIIKTVLNLIAKKEGIFLFSAFTKKNIVIISLRYFITLQKSLDNFILIFCFDQILSNSGQGYQTGLVYKTNTTSV